MTPAASRQLWRKAKFLCHCSTSNKVDYGIRSFCSVYSYLVPSTDATFSTIYPSCTSYESWEHNGLLCLACQHASAIFRIIFEVHFETFVNKWLPTSSDLESSTDESDKYRQGKNARTMMCSRPIPKNNPSDSSELFKLRRHPLNESLTAIRRQSSHAQNQHVFQEISTLQKDFKRMNRKPLCFMTTTHQKRNRIRYIHLLPLVSTEAIYVKKIFQSQELHSPT
jgi:hypothetical protein